MKPNEEEEVQRAIKIVQSRRFRSIRQTTLATTVPRSTIGHRLAGRSSRDNITLKTERLTAPQKGVLIQYILDLQLQFQPPNHHQIHFIAQQLANQNGPPRDLGKNWVSRFVNRSPQLKTGKLTPLSIERVTA